MPNGTFRGETRAPRPELRAAFYERVLSAPNLPPCARDLLEAIQENPGISPLSGQPLKKKR